MAQKHAQKHQATIVLPIKDQLEELTTLAVVINSSETENQARKHLIVIRNAKRELKTQVDALKAPHKEAIKQIDKVAGPYKTLLEEKDSAFEKGILDYQRRVREEAAVAQAKLVATYERKSEKAMQKAIEEGKPMPLITPPAILATPPKSVEVDGVRQTTTVRRGWRIKASPQALNTMREIGEKELTAEGNELLGLGIPLKYFKLNRGAIAAVIKAGGDIPGIETFPDEGLTLVDQDDED